MTVHPLTPFVLIYLVYHIAFWLWPRGLHPFNGCR